MYECVQVKVLEQQLEQEHEERINFLRERHELEGKIMGLQDLLDRSGDEEQVAKLKKDLKRTKALLKDAQMMIEKSQNEGTNKVIMRQLKNQVKIKMMLVMMVIVIKTIMIMRMVNSWKEAMNKVIMRQLKNQVEMKMMVVNGDDDDR